MRLKKSTILPGFGPPVLPIKVSLVKSPKLPNWKFQGRKPLGAKRKLSDFDQLFEWVDWWDWEDDRCSDVKFKEGSAKIQARTTCSKSRTKETREFEEGRYTNNTGAKIERKIVILREIQLLQRLNKYGWLQSWCQLIKLDNKRYLWKVLVQFRKSSHFNVSRCTENGWIGSIDLLDFDRPFPCK